jgi:hypothetical protein
LDCFDQVCRAVSGNSLGKVKVPQGLGAANSLATTFHLGLILPLWVHSELARLKDVTAELNERYMPEREAAAKGDDAEVGHQKPTT